MTRRINKDTRLCISLSGRPSNVGTRFHNFLYEELGLDFVYKAFTTTDIRGAITGIRALGIRGAGISMPWKSDVIELLDALAPSAAAIDSVNTIVNDEGWLTGFNTDYQAIVDLLKFHNVPKASSFAVLGSGGMAKAAVAALTDSGFINGIVAARNQTTGRLLADRYGHAWLPALSEPVDLLLNATPVGMSGGPEESELPVSEPLIEAARTIFDVVAYPSETPLVQAATSAGKVVITGSEVIALQAAQQFHLYTGVRPTADQIRRAAAFSRS